MRFVCISDVHGQYDKMMSALQDANFNQSSDCLVSLGDLFDRGPQSKEILEYVMSLPNKILLWGNHDSRLKEIIDLEISNWADYFNGVEETFNSFLGYKEQLLSDGARALKQQPIYELLCKYFQECHYAAEFSDFIATHAWLPNALDWRTASKKAWEHSLWTNVEEKIREKDFTNDKNLIVGHWHAFRVAQLYRGVSDFSNIDFNVFIANEEKDIIFIDGCSNYTYGGKVNTFVFEDNFENITLY